MAKKAVAFKIEETIDTAFTFKCKQDARLKGAVLERMMMLYSAGLFNPFENNKGTEDAKMEPRNNR